MKYVALLRGVNLGSRNKLPMADLRALLRSLGYDDVTTYLQSGNALFTSGQANLEVLAGEIEAGIARDFGLDIRVLIRTPDDLAKVVEGSPFRSETASPSPLFVCFLSARPEDERLSAIDAGQFSPDTFAVGERAIYLWLPGGFHRTKLTNAFWERRLGLDATIRNWNTVTKLLGLAQE